VPMHPGESVDLQIQMDSDLAHRSLAGGLVYLVFVAALWITTDYSSRHIPSCLRSAAFHWHARLSVSCWAIALRASRPDTAAYFTLDSPLRPASHPRRRRFQCVGRYPSYSALADPHSQRSRHQPRRLKTLVEMRGHSATAVSNGNEVLRKIEWQELDIVLMDTIHMPELDG